MSRYSFFCFLRGDALKSSCLAVVGVYSDVYIYIFCLSPQDATRSPRCSATLRQLCCVWAVQQSCVSPPEARRVSQRVSINLEVDNVSGGSRTDIRRWDCSQVLGVGLAVDFVE